MASYRREMGRRQRSISRRWAAVKKLIPRKLKGMKRILKEELLDADQGSPHEVASALRSLRWINRLFGGDSMHTRLLRHATAGAPARPLHLLEVASGRADALQTAIKRLCWQQRVRITLLDRSAQHLPPRSAWSADLPAPELIAADALHIPLPADSVDIVGSCLFLHHLRDSEARIFLAEALRVARIAVVINDLERHPVHYLLSRIASLVDPSRLSRHDGPVSVRRAYTTLELDRMLRACGYRFQVHRGFLFRLGLVVWKHHGPLPV
jgi:hypothetical protein